MLQLAKLNIDDDGSILVKINGRDCGLRFNQWAYVLASKSAGGRSISAIARDLADVGRNLEALSHLIHGAACNWCHLHNLEPWFNLAHIAAFILEDGPRTWAITDFLLNQLQNDSQAAANLFLNPN